jgi:Chaperone of endosialidase
MNQLIIPKTTATSGQTSVERSRLRHGVPLTAFALALAWFALSLTARAVTPGPDGDYGNGNTAEGGNALFSVTGGADNTAIGFQALFSNDGSSNTAIGDRALQSNTNGTGNTATGDRALVSNTIGFNNTANGASALLFNATGQNNTASGDSALYSNTTGSSNTANGSAALLFNTIGRDNTANGNVALASNTSGSNNTANGVQALYSNTTGGGNTANGYLALPSNITGGRNTANGLLALGGNTTGSNNTALGSKAGINLTTGSNNIDIGALGVAGDSNIIRIGQPRVQMAAYIQGITGTPVASGVTVIVGTNGHLGTIVSSERFKEGIKPMDEASEAILALKPVTFRYKHELDPEGIPQFGLIAEQVEKVDPNLVVRDEDGKVNTVRYEAVNAMLLNEFLKEHRKLQEQDRKVQEQEATIAQLKSAALQQEAVNAEQRNEMQFLAALLRRQESQIQKICEQVEMSQAAGQFVENNQ